MTLDGKQSDYPLGYSDAEHERLIRQAVRLAAGTEKFFREAGMVPGQRILDIGSGVGDVSMLSARIVGPGGSVVGVEKDARSVDRARKRAAEAGFSNIRFVQTDVAHYASDSTFDGVVGRFILQFLHDPVALLRSTSNMVRQGGIIAFQEGSWAPFVALSSHLPLRSLAVSLLRELALRAGTNVEMGTALHKTFLDAGLPKPNMKLEMELDCEPDFTRWLSDRLILSRQRIGELDLRDERLGDWETLQQRLQEEVLASNTVVPWIALVGAWCHTPISK